MILDDILKPFDNLLVSINNNKIILLLILILLGIYTTHLNQNIVEKSLNLFENKSFRLIIFIIITYISKSSPAIGIGLAIIMLISMQIITSIKFKKEFDSNIDINNYI